MMAFPRWSPILYLIVGALPAHAQVEVIPPEAPIYSGLAKPVVFRLRHPAAATRAWAWTVREPQGGDILRNEQGEGVYQPPAVAEPTYFHVRAAAEDDSSVADEVRILVRPGEGAPALFPAPSALEAFAGDAGGLLGLSDGPTTGARFQGIQGLLFVPRHPNPALDGRWLVLDGDRLRAVTPDGTVETLGAWPRSEDDRPVRLTHMAMDPGVPGQGGPRIFFSDPDRHQIWVLEANGDFRVLAGPGFREQDRQLQFRRPQALAVDDHGRVWVADSDNDAVRRISPDGQVTTLAGPGIGSSDEGVPGRLNQPAALALAPRTGSCLVADRTALYRIDPELGLIALGVMPEESPFLAEAKAGDAGLGQVRAMSVVGDHLFLVEGAQHRVRRLDLATSELVTLVQAHFQEGLRPGPLLSVPGTPVLDAAALRNPVAVAFSPQGQGLVAWRGGLALLRLPQQVGFPAPSATAAQVGPGGRELTYGDEPLVLGAHVSSAVQPSWKWSLAGGACDSALMPGRNGSALFQAPFVLAPTEVRVQVHSASDRLVAGSGSIRVAPHPVTGLIFQYLGEGWDQPHLEHMAGDPKHPGGQVDGSPLKAQFSNIRSLLWLPSHPLPELNRRWLVADGGALRTLDRNGEVATFALRPEGKGPGMNEPFSLLEGLALAPKAPGLRGPLILVTDSGQGRAWVLDGNGQFHLVAAELAAEPGAPRRQATALVTDPATGDLLLAEGCMVQRAVPGLGASPMAGRQPAPGEGCAFMDWDAQAAPTKAGTLGLGVGCFGKLGGMALVGDDLWICDSGNHALRVLNLANGSLCTLLGGPGQDQTRCGPLTGRLDRRAALATPVAIAFNESGECLVATDRALYGLVLPDGYWRQTLAGAGSARKGRDLQMEALNPGYYRRFQDSCSLVVGAGTDLVSAGTEVVSAAGAGLVVVVANPALALGSVAFGTALYHDPRPTLQFVGDLVGGFMVGPGDNPLVQLYDLCRWFRP